MEWTLCFEHWWGVRWISEGFLKKVSLELGIESSLSFALLEIRRQRSLWRTDAATMQWWGWPADIRAQRPRPEHRGHLLGIHLLLAALRTRFRSLDSFQWARVHPCGRRERVNLAFFLFLVQSVSGCLLGPLPEVLCPPPCRVTRFPPLLSSFPSNGTFSVRPSLSTLFKIIINPKPPTPPLGLSYSLFLHSTYHCLIYYMIFFFIFFNVCFVYCVYTY